MTQGTSDVLKTDPQFAKITFEAAIRIGVLVLLVGWCFDIVKPFVLPIIWGVILAVALHPLFKRLQHAVGDRGKLAATLITLLALAIIIVPTVTLVGFQVATTEALATGFREGTLKVPPPIRNT